MTHTSTQPEALRLADSLEQFAYKTAKQSAAELRRQHARIEELEAQLSVIGVEPLRKCLHQIAEPGCTRSHPHEAMSPECRIRAVIAEMRNREARGAEATEHCLGRFADVLERALADRAMQAQAAPDERKAFDDFAEDVEDNECHNCSGTGEGMYDSQSCVVCLGKGFL